QLEEQLGDEEITPFSFETKENLENKISCYITYTTEKTKQIILDNLHRSPLYGGDIKGIGPRYCPSIEDKIVRFKDKERHQLFVEPMGMNTEEMYIQGFSSSMPEDVQLQMIHSLPGFENAQVMRNAYAIEYDCADPLQLQPSLEFKKISGLFGAGQFNGTSGYEEAAAQGLIAGINAARKLAGKDPVIIDRSEAYIGALIDDLVTKGTNEPYRMMTSRSEYRLLLRQDNADLRLTPLGYEIGLISEERYQTFLEKKKKIEDEIERLSNLSLSPTKELQEYLESVESTPLKSGIRAAELLKRPQVDYMGIAPFDKNRPELKREVWEQAEISLKYDGYIKRQLSQAAQLKKLEQKTIPDGIDYLNLDGLRLEARQKLDKIRPKSIGQASRISGVSPADITVLMLYIKEN
ncbi:MAG: tRNA uridine-5-carboxymethylaminomethyl(34) synthesis enzyme MnmG, partial [Clostridia bacterium]|nr:tRNA uridine-5-carboxymethylaminomethyl(34) synthesis enzyme MnmG [Clostridia bacterium]